MPRQWEHEHQSAIRRIAHRDRERFGVNCRCDVVMQAGEPMCALKRAGTRALMQHAIKKHERRNPLVGGAMNK